MNSYSVRCFFLWELRPEQVLQHLYEERITLWRAQDLDGALELAEREAKAYAAENGVEFLEYSQAYEMSDQLDTTGVEVFSLLRESNLKPSDYLDAFFDTAAERQQRA